MSWKITSLISTLDFRILNRKPAVQIGFGEFERSGHLGDSKGYLSPAALIWIILLKICLF